MKNEEETYLFLFDLLSLVGRIFLKYFFYFDQTCAYERSVHWSTSFQYADDQFYTNSTA